MLLLSLLLLVGTVSAGWNPMYLHRIDEDLVKWVSEKDIFVINMHNSRKWGSPRLMSGVYYVDMKHRSWSRPAKQQWNYGKDSTSHGSMLIPFKSYEGEMSSGTSEDPASCLDMDKMGCDVFLNLTTLVPKYATIYFHDMIEDVIPNYGGVHEVMMMPPDKRVCISLRRHPDWRRKDGAKEWSMQRLIRVLLELRGSNSSSVANPSQNLKFVATADNCFTTTRSDVSYYHPRTIRESPLPDVQENALALVKDLSRLVPNGCGVTSNESLVFGKEGGPVINLLLAVRQQHSSRSFENLPKMLKVIQTILPTRKSMARYQFVLRTLTPEHTMKEQTCLCGTADILLHFHGSVAANAMFMRLNSIVVEMSAFHKEIVPTTRAPNMTHKLSESPAFYDTYFWRSNVHPIADIRTDLRWYVIAFRDTRVLHTQSSWYWSSKDFRKRIDSLGHMWSQKVKHSTVDLKKRECQHLVKVISRAISEKESRLASNTQ